MNVVKLLAAMAVLTMIGCASGDVRPVELFPEDNCSGCRMAISDAAFASEIINNQGEAFKFDDLGCLEKFRAKTPAQDVRAVFVKDYGTRTWVLYEKSTIVRTGIRTPMGSGNVAFSNPESAKEFASQHPPDLSAENGSACCSMHKD